MRKSDWWRNGVFYQIYLRSFMDTSGDGIGDIPGVIAKLDYLEWLGADVLWLTPINPSPMADLGYDVSDFRDVDPVYGTLADMDRLVQMAHKRGMKIILDFVPNHTSDEHPWFRQSRSSKDNPKRDWYMWHDPKPDGSPPNNWLSIFGGGAWTWDASTGQYYFHSFLERQPELNWRNRRVRRAIYDVMRFWLDRGIDGFRLDAMWHLIKDRLLRSNPINPDYTEGQLPYDQLKTVFSTDQPETHEILCEMRNVIEPYGGRVLMGELYLSVQRLVAYYGCEKAFEVDMPLNYHLIHTPWNARQVERTICEYEGLLPDWAWPNWSLGNHDMKRTVSRIGAAQARVAAMLQFTLRGTPTIYYGEEIGMEEVPVPAGHMMDPQRLVTEDLHLGRDSRRTPMQWENRKGAGFTSGEPWLPIPKQLGRRTVESQRDDSSSLLSLYRQLARLRRSELTLISGIYMPLPEENNLLAFRRELGMSKMLVVLNLGHRAARYQIKDPPDQGVVLLGTTPGREGETVRGQVKLRGDEGLVIRLKEQ